MPFYKVLYRTLGSCLLGEGVGGIWGRCIWDYMGEVV